MKAFKWITASLVLGISSTLFAGESNGVVVSHYERLQRLNIQTDSAETSQKIRGAGPVTLSFDALGSSFDLRLETNVRLLSTASRNASPDGLAIYRGRMAGNPDSWARIVVFDGMPRGIVWDGEQMFAIESPGDSIVQASSPIIFRLADTYIEPGTMSCGAKSLSGNGAAMYGKLIGELKTAAAQAPGAVSEINFGAIGDFEFTSAEGGDAAAAAAIIDRLNRVDGIYSQEIGVQINVPFLETFSDPADNPFTTPVDPMTNETDPSLLLDELATYRDNTPAHSSQGLTHLYTGRDLDGSTVGIAYSGIGNGTGVLCHPSAGAGLSEGNRTPMFDSLIAAHEIGHNFGAPHDGDMGGACASEPPDAFIMASSLNLSMQFSDCSKAIMEASAAQASCVTPLPTVDMSVALSGQLATVLLGNSATLTFDVANNGTLQATNVGVDITLPNNVSFVSAGTSTGSCTNGAGTVNCVLGDVGGSSLNEVTVSTISTAVGVGTVDAIVTSDFDERPGNNQDSVQLTVDPAVDLVVNAPAAASINLDQSTTVNAVLENRSMLIATGVTLSISLNSGLRADSASWSIGTCTVTDQQIDCQTANFADQSSSTLNVGVTGLTAGARSYTVTLASNEADADPVNNSVNGTVSVTDPNRKSSGGAFGLPFLCLLGLAAILTRRRLVRI